MSNKFNWSGIEFPVTLEHIDKFEKQNPTISVNVLGFENSIYPLRISEHVYKPDTKTIILLLISDEEKQHY